MNNSRPADVSQMAGCYLLPSSMRHALIYLLLAATLLPTISPWGTIAYYQVNKDYIARVLCENRDKPQLHCDGKCYLAKKLKAQQDKQDKETTDRVQNSPVLSLFCNDYSEFDFLPPTSPEPGDLLTDYLLKSYTATLPVPVQPPRA